MRLITLIGYLIFSALCFSTIDSGKGIYPSLDYIDVPSILLVFGCALGLILMAKIVPSSNNASKLKLYQLLTCAFFISAILINIIGCIQIIINCVDASTIGPSMAISMLPLLYGLLAVVLISYPLEDASAKKMKFPNEFSLSQIVWFFFPVYSVMFVLITFYVLMFSLSAL